jgi:hypothetical protein
MRTVPSTGATSVRSARRRAPGRAPAGGGERDARGGERVVEPDPRVVLGAQLLGDEQLGAELGVGRAVTTQPVGVRERLGEQDLDLLDAVDERGRALGRRSVPTGERVARAALGREALWWAASA